MYWNTEGLQEDFIVLREKLDDVLTTHIWHGEDMYRFKELTNSTNREHYVLGYSKSRIQHEQTADLLTIYLDKFEKLISRFNELLEQEKSALSHADQSEDNTHN